MTEFLFRADSYLQSTPATVVAVRPDGGIVLDRTVFYATSGGQPGDSGWIETADKDRIGIVTAIHPEGDKTAIVHVPTEGHRPLAVGEVVTAHIDWDRRYKLMRMHSALHLLSVVFPYSVTGGSIGEDKGRLDFDMPEVPDNIDALLQTLNTMVADGHLISEEWITDSEMLAKPELIKTMKVKPPTGQGRVRLVRIGSIDLQPCGGTHVANTREIGPLTLGKIEKKGKQNRRVTVLFGQ